MWVGAGGRMGTCTGSSLWARARAARSGSRRGCESEHPLLARYFTSLVLHAFGLHSATPHSPRSPLRARVRGSCSGLGLGTRGSRSGSYSYSGLALDRTLGRCDRNNPVALRAFRIQQPALAIGGLVLYALHAVGPRVGRADAVDGEPTAIAGHRCPPLGPSEGDVNEKLEKTEEEIGQTEAVEKKGEMLQEEVIAR